MKQIRIELGHLSDRNDRSLWLITVIVICLHLFFIGWTTWEKSPLTTQLSTKRLVVKTVTLKPTTTTSTTQTIPQQEPLIAPSTQQIAEQVIESRQALPEPDLEAPPASVQAEEPPKPTPPPAKAKTAPPKKQPTSKPAVSKKTVPAKPKEPPAKKKTIPKSTPKPKVDNSAKEAEKTKRRELLANAQKSIAKMQSAHDTLAPKSNTEIASSTIPGRIETLSSQTLAIIDEGNSFSEQEHSYHEELASRLKLLLRLPEFGSVKIQLTLKRSGEFVAVSVVNAKSNKNRTYIEKMLPTLNYPGFGDNFTGKDQHTFTINLSNDL